METKEAFGGQRTQHLGRKGSQSRYQLCVLQTTQPEPSLKSRGKEVTRRQLLFLICSLEKVPGKLASGKSERMTDATNKGFHLMRNVGEERRARNVKGELRKLEVSHV